MPFSDFFVDDATQGVTTACTPTAGSGGMKLLAHSSSKEK
jgi:hypothetical protein